MSIVVQKYGGSSVANLEKLGGVADRIAKAVGDGHQVVVVVSAMGNTTNELLNLASQLSKNPNLRELDMLISVGERISMALLAMALHERGCSAVSLTGSQSGIITDESHADASVVEVRPGRVLQCLADGHVVIVAGFQGVSRAREVTTLGRGGSDTTAVVIAAAIGAEYCEICSDVDGVFSADPRIVASAQKIDRMSADEAVALSRGGAKVLFEDAVLYARAKGVALQASSTFGPGSGTRISTQVESSSLATAVTGDARLHRLSVDVSKDIGPLLDCGIRLRRRVGDTWWVDMRNAHAGLPTGDWEDQGPTAMVTAVGSRLGESMAALQRVDAALGEMSTLILRSGGDGDALWWEVAPSACRELTQRIHRCLIG